MQARTLHLIKSYFLSYTGFSRQCYYGFIISLIEAIFIGIYYYLPIYFTDFLQLDLSTSGMIISCYGIGSILGGIAGGKLSDQWSPGLVTSIALLIQAIVYFLLMKFQSITFLMCNIFILGIASYAFITANHLFVLSCCSENDNQKLRAINILSMTSNLGLGLTALIISSVYSFGFHIIFVVASFILIILAYTSYVSSGENNSIRNKIKVNNQKPTDQLQFAKSSSNKIIMLILPMVFLIGLIVSQLSTTYSSYVRSEYSELGLKAVTTLFALNAFIVVLFSAPLGDYIKNFNNTLMVGLGGFCIGLGMCMLTFSHYFGMVLFACIIYTVGEIIFFSMAQFIFYQNSLPNKKGKSLGLYRMVYASSRVIGPSIGGLIYVNFGGNIIWIISGIIGFCCLVLSYLL